jgi:glycosyltransferase involved in cell wall biosynthesis
MRILLTADAELPVPPLHYGGIERVIASLIEEFRHRGHVVGLVAHSESTADVDSFFPWPGKSSQERLDSLSNAWALNRAASAFRPDVLHSFSRLMWLLPLALSAPKLPIVMSYQRDPSGRTVRLARRIMGDRLCFTGCSQSIADLGLSRGGGDWHGIPNFIDPGKFTFQPNVDSDAPLVFLSRIEPIKGCHSAIAIAKSAGRRLLIAGNRVETGSAAGYWDREIAPHLGRDGIEYVGTVNDTQKNELLGSAAAMLVPIEWEEPFGIVFTEALACGTPVISSPRGALPEIVESGKQGFLISSVEEGISAVQRIGEIARTECRRRVEEKFTLSVVADQYLKLYMGQIYS